MVEYLTNEQYRQEKRKLIQKSIEGGQFSLLPPRAQQILTVKYLNEDPPSYEEIGKMFTPSISDTRVTQIEAKALRILRGPIRRFPIDSLDLPVRGRNALIRAGFDRYSLEKFAQLSDEELQFIRGVGVKTVRALREKLTAHLPQQV